MMSATFGRSSPRQFAEYDPDTSSWRTWPDTGLWGSTLFSGTWPRSGMTRRGRAYELSTLAPLIDGSGSSSLLPTPEAKLSDSGPDYARATREGSGGDDLTTTLARLLPTPRATDGTNGGPNQRGSSGDLMLPSAVVQLLPTPTAMDYKASGGSTPSDVTLKDAIVRTELGAVENSRHVLLPTPGAADARGVVDHKGLNPTLGGVFEPERLAARQRRRGASTSPLSDDGNGLWDE